MLTQAAGAVGARFRSLLVFLEGPGAPEFPSGHPGGAGEWVGAVVCWSAEPAGPRSWR